MAHAVRTVMNNQSSWAAYALPAPPKPGKILTYFFNHNIEITVTTLSLRAVESPSKQTVGPASNEDFT